MHTTNPNQAALAHTSGPLVFFSVHCRVHSRAGHASVAHYGARMSHVARQAYVYSILVNW